MGQFIGTYIAIIIMELIVAIPSYYILRFIFKKLSVELIALTICFVALAAGWTAGYRFTKDVMVSNYLSEAKEQTFITTEKSLEQREWLVLRREFTNNSDNVTTFNVGAAKLSLPSTIIVAILLFALAQRHKKKKT